MKLDHQRVSGGLEVGEAKLVIGQQEIWLTTACLHPYHHHRGPCEQGPYEQGP